MPFIAQCQSHNTSSSAISSPQLAAATRVVPNRNKAPRPQWIAWSYPPPQSSAAAADNNTIYKRSPYSSRKLLPASPNNTSLVGKEKKSSARPTDLQSSSAQQRTSHRSYVYAQSPFIKAKLLRTATAANNEDGDGD